LHAVYDVIACDKRKAFAQGSVSDGTIQVYGRKFWIASLSLAMTAEDGYTASTDTGLKLAKSQPRPGAASSKARV
jgi:hypothetical protein